MDTSEPKSLYVGPGYEEATHTYGAEMTTRTIDSYRQGWKLYAVIDPKIALSFRERSRPINVLWGGMLFSTFVAGFIYLLLLNRTRHLSERESEEIQSAKDELLALASHQLRTPATGVKQYLGILREGMAGQLNVEQTEVLEKAYASNERQLGTINEMLVVAKADNGHLDIQMQAVDINHLVNEIVDEARDYADKRSHHLNVYLSKQPMYIMGDREYLRMAIENVISNANKYTPDGGTVTITLLKKKGNVEVIIRDNGVGVAKQDFHMLFEKFSRIPNKLTRQVGGSGIGLYLAKKIIHQHNGTIGFESTHGEGSVCSIRLPIMQHDNKPEA